MLRFFSHKWSLMSLWKLQILSSHRITACGDHEIWGSTCVVLSCLDLNANASSTTTEANCVNEQACVCQPGWYRDSEGDCIEQGQCECLGEDRVSRYPGESWMTDNCTTCLCEGGVVTCSSGCEDISCEEVRINLFQIATIKTGKQTGTVNWDKRLTWMEF